MPTTKQLTSFVIVTTIVLIWSGSFIFIRVALTEIPPATLALARFFVASPVLVGLTFLTWKRGNLTKVDWKRDFILFTALSLSGVTLLYVLQFYSLKFVTSTVGSILISLNVVFTALLSSAFLKESMTKRKLGGVLLAFAGVVVLATEGKLVFESGSFQPIGTLLMLGAAFCWATYSILSKKVLDRYSATAATSVAFCLGTLYLVPFAMAESPLGPLANASWIAWISILYLAVPSSAIAYLLWNYMLAKVDVTKLTVSLYAIPIPTAIFSYLFLNETITQSLVFGGALVIAGIYLTESSRNMK